VLPFGAGKDRLRLGEGLGDGIDAEAVLDARGDVRLGVGRAGQVQVEVRALRHAEQKVAQEKRFGADAVEVLSGAPLAFRRLPCGRAASGKGS
jgi:hypothetical protein